MSKVNLSTETPIPKSGLVYVVAKSFTESMLFCIKHNIKPKRLKFITVGYDAPLWGLSQQPVYLLAGSYPEHHPFYLRLLQHEAAGRIKLERKG